MTVYVVMARHDSNTQKAIAAFDNEPAAQHKAANVVGGVVVPLEIKQEDNDPAIINITWNTILGLQCEPLYYWQNTELLKNHIKLNYLTIETYSHGRVFDFRISLFVDKKFLNQNWQEEFNSYCLAILEAAKTMFRDGMKKEEIVKVFRNRIKAALPSKEE